MAAEAVADDELGALLDCLSGFPLAVLAVSGGADSMALMVLAARWLALKRGKGPAVEVATVDHGLRPEAADEARFVAIKARALGFKHTTLVWEGTKPESGIQQAAREARFALLGAHARACGRAPAAIVTAHTRDDQAETLLMRLARGSGIDGLSAMAPQRSLDGLADVTIVRPLLGLSRSRLIATLAQASMDWVDDPSNASLDFERVRLRAAEAELGALGLTPEKLAASAQRLARAREALDQTAHELMGSIADLNDGVFARLDRDRLRAVPLELSIKVLARVLEAFGGQARAARLSQVEVLAEQLAGPAKIAVTLGGCIVTAEGREVRICRECERADLPQTVLEPGSTETWDRRFRVSLAPARKLKALGIEEPVVVRSLGRRAYATLRPAFSPRARPPAAAAWSLPSFWSGESLIGVPQLVQYGFTCAGHEACKAEFIGPSAPSRFERA